MALNSPFLLLLLATTTLFLHTTTTTAANVPASDPLLKDVFEPIKVSPEVEVAAKWAVKNQKGHLGLVYSRTRCAEVKVDSQLGATEYRLLILAHDQDGKYNFYEASVDDISTNPESYFLNYFVKAPFIHIPTASAFEKGSSADLKQRYPPFDNYAT